MSDCSLCLELTTQAVEEHCKQTFLWCCNSAALEICHCWFQNPRRDFNYSQRAVGPHRSVLDRNTRDRRACWIRICCFLLPSCRQLWAWLDPPPPLCSRCVFACFCFQATLIFWPPSESETAPVLLPRFPANFGFERWRWSPAGSAKDEQHLADDMATSETSETFPQRERKWKKKCSLSGLIANTGVLMCGGVKSTLGLGE